MIDEMITNWEKEIVRLEIMNCLSEPKSETRVMIWVKILSISEFINDLKKLKEAERN